MLTDLIRKDWGTMIPLSTFDRNGEPMQGTSWIAVIEHHRETSIHRHNCDSSIAVIEGCVAIYFDHDDVFILTNCEQIEIPSGVNHMIVGIADTSVLLETYQSINLDGQYDITRLEEWPGLAGDDTEEKVVSE